MADDRLAKMEKWAQEVKAAAEISYWSEGLGEIGGKGTKVWRLAASLSIVSQSARKMRDELDRISRLDDPTYASQVLVECDALLADLERQLKDAPDKF